MARPEDPLDDVLRVAEHLDSVVVLLDRGADCKDIVTGLALRLREDVDTLRNDKT